MTTTTTTTTKTTMTGDATNGFDGLYGYKRPLDEYNDDNMCSGEESGSGGVGREEECKVEDREWSVAIIAAAANANPQPTGSIVLDKTPGESFMREYESIVVASASSSSGNDDDDGMSINDNFDRISAVGGRFKRRRVRRHPARCRRTLGHAHQHCRQQR